MGSALDKTLNKTLRFLCLPNCSPAALLRNGAVSAEQERECLRYWLMPRMRDRAFQCACHRNIPVQPGVSPTTKPVVLVAEGEWLLREDIVEELQKADLFVISASTAEGAIDVLRAGQRVDAIVTDIQLAGELKGWDIADAFRSVDPNVPVIYVSGTAPNPARSVPGSLFIPKPYRADRIVQMVRKLLSN